MMRRSAPPPLAPRAGIPFREPLVHNGRAGTGPFEAAMYQKVLSVLTILMLGLLAGVMGGGETPKGADNRLTDEEKAAGWQLLFDGKSLAGWMTSARKPSRTPVADGSLNPHGCGDYMIVHEKEWSDFVLSLDFRISKDCNSGIFI